jgi:Leucine-rich repeat (LRR) protein
VELKGFRQFTNLQQLSLSYNMIKDLGQLQHLRPLSESLHALSLDGNMIADHPAYRHCCLALLPRLRTLDSKPVTFNERQDVSTCSNTLSEHMFPTNHHAFVLFQRMP